MSADRPSGKPLLIRAADRARIPEEGPFSHPFNPHSEIRGHLLARMVGLQRVGVTLMRIAPGKESFVLHSHRFEEEWMFILSGRGVAQVGDEEHEVGPGDFLGFPTPSVAHHLRNPFDEELVYLSGGENRELEVADFPQQRKRMVRMGQDVTLFPLDAAEPFPTPKG